MDSEAAQIEQPPPTPWKDRDIILPMVSLSPGEELLRIRGQTKVRVSMTNRVAGFSTVAQFEKKGEKWGMAELVFSAPGLHPRVYVDGAYGAISTDDIQAIVSLVQSNKYNPGRISIINSDWVKVKTGGFRTSVYSLRVYRVHGVWTIVQASLDYLS